MPFAAPVLRALRLTLVIWLLSVVLISLPMLVVARLVAPEAASGSLLRRDGAVVGSRWIGQRFSGAGHLWGRPAAAPYLAPANPALSRRVAQAAARWRAGGVARPAPDLLLDSASGVDPHISLAAARQQLPRLARERRLPLAALERLLRRHLEGPWGLRAIEPVVNVLTFNLALEDQRPT